MPSDIRSFFGGGGGAKAAGSSSKLDKASGKPEKKSRSRKVVSDDDEDEEEVKPKKTVTPKKKKPAPAPQEEETTSSAYFASKSKTSNSKSTPIRSKPAASTNGTTSTPSKVANGATPSTGRRSARKASKKSYAEDEDEDTKALLDDDEDGNDDIFADNFKSRKADDGYEEGSNDDDPVLRPSARPKTNGQVTKQESDDEDGDLEMAELPAFDGGSDSKRKRTSTTKATRRKRKSQELDDDDEDDFLDDDEDEAPKKKSRKTAPKSTPKKPRVSTKKEEKEDSKEMQEIYDSIPTIRPPTPPPRDPESSKFKYQYGGGNANKEPMAAGSKAIPEGADNCLAGLTFVFTGVLDTLGREDGQNLVKQYGGKVTGAPSKKTSYVVVGHDAGPKKLETIRSLGIKAINEDGLFELIKKLPPGGGDSKAAEAWAEKQEKEQEKIRKQAEEMELLEKEKEREAAKAAKAAADSRGAPPPPKSTRPKVNDRLWVDKYAPESLTAVCGNKTQVEKLQRWLRNWRKNAQANFKKGGIDGNGNLRAAMLHGPPGVGKTTAAHLVAKLEGYDVVETNASDTRSKKLMEQTLRGVLDTTSLLGYFAGDGKKVDSAKKNLVMIMDEVDGMSAGDRGGVGALAAVAKKTNIPMILICNERRLPKMKPFDFVTADFLFKRPTTDQIRARIATIAFREGLQLPTPVMNAIIEGSNADIRQVINMVSTIKLDNKDMDFNDSKAMSKAWEKHIILKPWDIVHKIMRAEMFAPSSTKSLNEKTELYFNDHEFSYLMLQESYLKSQPSLLGGYEGKERNLKYLELAEKASSSISDGDLVDRMIHGSQQQWSLMPLHAIFSFVKPASYVYGNFNTQVGFTSWLGQNSKQGKLGRYVKEIQGHMRLRTSADRNEIRQQYLPALWNQTVAKLINEGKESVPEVIDFMDSYYLTKEDYDAIMELGVGPMEMEDKPQDGTPIKKIDTQTKATFTRMYNAQNHPMPFVKASSVLGVSSKGGGGKREKPDLEEALEDSEADEPAVEGKEEGGEGEEEEDMDLSKDKYVKVPKKKAAGAAKAGKGAAKRKKGAAGDEDEGGESEDEKPKKKGGARKGKGKA